MADAHAHSAHGARLPALALGALGVVYGDIGTSPLYALRESFEGAGHELHVNETNVLGILSLVFWSLLIIITIKYLAFVMRADRDGEGGILTLTALISPPRGRLANHGRVVLILIGLFGTALLYGDGMITPAISVLSAIEGTEVATPAFEDWVIPIAVAILVGLFSIQRRRTATIGRVFGPIMVVWFVTLGVLGALHIFDDLDVFKAINPLYAVDFFAESGWHAFLALGSVFLVVTGGEALYADMGHFGRRPIQAGWFALVLPALLLNYFGQGAMLLAEPETIEHPFFNLVPQAGVLPLVVLATMATIIASQALISGVFSLTMQAVQMGYAPRVRIAHTSASAFGQIYIPAVNWALMVACIGLVLGFRSSTHLAAAYGVAVTMTMVITTLLFYVVLRERFGWSSLRAGLLTTLFLPMELGFLGANLFKIPAGGWFPLVVGAIVFTLLTTWRTGRNIVGERIRHGEVTLDMYLSSLMGGKEPPARVPGTAVYLFSVPGIAPPAMVANLRHNAVLHDQVVILSIETSDDARVLPARRSEISDCGHGVHQVVLHYGFMEDPNIPEGLRQGAALRLGIDPDTATYFLGSESLVVTDRPGMAKWRERLFATVSRNATNAATFFGLPPQRVVTLGQQVEL